MADTLERAEYAAYLVKVEYTQEAAKTSFDAAKAHAETPKNIMGEDTEVKHRDAEEALAAAWFKVDHTYTTPRSLALLPRLRMPFITRLGSAFAIFR